MGGQDGAAVQVREQIIHVGTLHLDEGDANEIEVRGVGSARGRGGRWCGRHTVHRTRHARLWC